MLMIPLFTQWLCCQLFYLKRSHPNSNNIPLRFVLMIQLPTQRLHFQLYHQLEHHLNSNNIPLRFTLTIQLSTQGLHFQLYRHLKHHLNSLQVMLTMIQLSTWRLHCQLYCTGVLTYSLVTMIRKIWRFWGQERTKINIAIPNRTS